MSEMEGSIDHSAPFSHKNESFLWGYHSPVWRGHPSPRGLRLNSPHNSGYARTYGQCGIFRGALKGHAILPRCLCRLSGPTFVSDIS